MTPLLGMFDSVGYVVMVVFGVGFLIFFHELGHFMAAKAAGVGVRAFSIGMGPRLFGWRRGETDYKFCLLPIGGYVSMHGEVPGEGDPHDPKDLGNKSVSWRFLIFSGGVIMNLIFALIAFPLVFNSGVPFAAPIVGHVAPSSSAWEAGLTRGDRILQVNGKDVYSFDQLFMEGALSGDDGMVLRVERGDREFDIRVKPRFNETTGLKLIGFSGTAEDEVTVRLEPGGGPARAAGLRDGDVMLTDFGVPATPQGDVEVEWQQRLEPLRVFAEKREVQIRRGGEELTVAIAPKRKDAGGPRLGIAMLTTRVVGLRTLGDARIESGLAALGLRKGDIVTGVHAVSGKNQLVLRGEDVAALLAVPAAEGPVDLVVLRVGPKAKERGPAPTKVLRVPDVFRGKEGSELFLRATGWGLDDLSGHVLVQAGLAASLSGIATGDRILELGGREVRNWTDLRTRVAEAKGQALAIRWQPRPTTLDEPLPAVREAKIQPAKVPVPDYGFTPLLKPRMEVYRVPGFFGSVKAGFVCSIDTIRQLYVTLKRILGGSVSATNLGGIITISRATYDYASQGWQRFLWFLAIISLNLAFINVLPIPVLDGGQLMFLLIEKIKGSPVSVRVMTYAQVLGIAMVLLLLIFVTFNDIRRLL